MLRIALLFFCLLGLATSAATAGPSAAQRTPLALRNQRLTRGNHVPVYTDYRYHSRERRGLLSFLNFGSRRQITARHRANKNSTHTPHKRGRHTSGLF
ncbi:MAG: hypothetical protein EOO62_24810 [Hymenobacter sp.]|nr:MAG: hypothetical protein EOO62_24810 [Hymenobacter sp.]